MPDGTDAVILELGANDVLRGVDPNVTRAALDAILRRLKERSIEVLLAGMRAPPQHGRGLCARLRRDLPRPGGGPRRGVLSVLPRRGRRRPQAQSADGLHPTAAGIDVIVARILPKVEELIARVTREAGLLNVAAACAAMVIASPAHPYRQPTQAEDLMPRLFTGLEIPHEIGEALSMLRGGLPGARWIDPENYHLTLRFIGDIDDALAREIAFMLGQVQAPPRSSCASTACPSFGGRQPRAVVAALPPIAPLIELQAEHERIMQRVGLEPEGRKFTPHVTLARLRDSSSRQVADYLAARGPLSSLSFPVSRFVLFSSRASVGGGPYVVEAAYPLAAERTASR